MSVEVRVTQVPTVEDILLGMVLTNEDARERVLAHVTPGDIADPELREIFTEVVTMQHLGLPIEPVLVGSRLTQAGSLVPKQRLFELDAVGREKAEAASVVHMYIDMVRSDAKARRFIAAAQQVVNEISVNPDLDDRLALAKMFLQDVEGSSLPVGGGKWFSEAIPEFKADIIDVWSGKPDPAVVPLGIEKLDKMLRGGVRRGELITVGARPGMGKSAFAIQLVMNVARSGRRVALFSAEMTLKSILRRATAEHTGLTHTLIDQVGSSGHEAHEARRRRYLEQLDQEVMHLPVYVDDTPGPTVAYMTETVKRLENIDLVVFDYLHLAGDKGPGRGESQEARISDISHKLAMMAKQCDVPVIALSQLSRAVEQRQSDEFVPTLSDLRDSGMVEANSHIVLLLYRRRYYVELGRLQDDFNSDRMRVIVAKNRDGATGFMELDFEPTTSQLRPRG